MNIQSNCVFFNYLPIYLLITHFNYFIGVYTININILSLKNPLFHLGELVLLEGEHVYPFTVSLPSELPSTYKDEYGHVRYKAMAVLNISRGSKIYKEIQFEVNCPINLNDEPFLAVSIGVIIYIYIN